MQNTDVSQPQLDIKDLQFLLQLVTICSQRGAFKAEELSSIGQNFDRVSAFLSSVTPVDESQNITTNIEHTENDPVDSSSLQGSFSFGEVND